MEDWTSMDELPDDVEASPALLRAKTLELPGVGSPMPMAVVGAQSGGEGAPASSSGGSPAAASSPKLKAKKGILKVKPSPAKKLEEDAQALMETQDTDLPMKKMADARKKDNEVPASIWTFNSINEGDWISLCQKVMHDYTPREPTEEEKWKDFCSRRMRELGKLTVAEPAPGVKWRLGWALKIASAEYKTRKETPRSGGPHGVQNPAKKITLVWRKELFKKYSSCVKLLTKYETTIAELQPKVDKLKTLKKKLEDKAHGKGVSLETDVAKKSAASEEGS
jgi:hypothetical protein